MPANPPKPNTQNQLSSRMDLASPDGQLPAGYARLIVNMLNGVRLPGLRRYGYDDPSGVFLNQDLHDQLLGAVRYQVYSP